jgi:polyferredoxin
MGTAMATRARVGLEVLHDRAPLFVKLRDGSIRNGYTVKIANKTQVPAAFVLSLGGLPEGAMSVAERSEARAPALALAVDADTIGEFRLLVFGRPAPSDGGSQKLVFGLRNGTTGESAAYTSVFIGPGR